MADKQTTNCAVTDLIFSGSFPKPLLKFTDHFSLQNYGQLYNTLRLEFCTICDRPFTDVCVHACCSCTLTEHLRDVLWNIIIENFDLNL